VSFEALHLGNVK